MNCNQDWPFWLCNINAFASCEPFFAATMQWLDNLVWRLHRLRCPKDRSCAVVGDLFGYSIWQIQILYWNNLSYLIGASYRYTWIYSDFFGTVFIDKKHTIYIIFHPRQHSSSRRTLCGASYWSPGAKSIWPRQAKDVFDDRSQQHISTSFDFIQ